MIKDNQKVFNRLLVIIDALITAVSFVLAYYIKFYINMTINYQYLIKIFSLRYRKDLKKSDIFQPLL